MTKNPNVKALRGIVAAWDAAIEAHNRAFRDQMAREKAAGCDEAAWDACLEAHGNGPELAAIEAAQRALHAEHMAAADDALKAAEGATVAAIRRYGIALEAEAGKSANVATLSGAVLVSWARRVLARS